MRGIKIGPISGGSSVSKFEHSFERTIFCIPNVIIGLWSLHLFLTNLASQDWWALAHQCHHCELWEMLAKVWYWVIISFTIPKIVMVSAHFLPKLVTATLVPKIVMFFTESVYSCFYLSILCFSIEKLIDQLSSNHQTSSSIREHWVSTRLLTLRWTACLPFACLIHSFGLLAFCQITHSGQVCLGNTMIRTPESSYYGGLVGLIHSQKMS